MTAFISITRVVHVGGTLNQPSHLQYHQEWISIDSISRVLDNDVIHIADTEHIVGQLYLDRVPSNVNHTIQTDETFAQLTGLIACAATLIRLNDDGNAYIASQPLDD